MLRSIKKLSLHFESAL